MAIILGSKNVKDLPEKDNVALGILLPITNGNNGYFAQSFNTLEAIKSNIKNLLLTRLGERVMQPNFGTRLWNLLFENNSTDDNIEKQIEEVIEQAIKNWMPFISIEEININKDDKINKEKYTYNVSILFRAPGIQNLETVTFLMTE